MHFELELLVRIQLVGAHFTHIAFYRPSEPMNYNMKWNMRQPAWSKSNLSWHLLNLKVLPTSKALKLYMAVSSTSTTNCFAPMFKQKAGQMYDELWCSSETLANGHWMSSVQNSCIRRKRLCMTCSNNKVRTLPFVEKSAHLTRMRT